MFLHMIKIVFICIIVNKVTALPVKISREDDKVERIDFDTEMHDYFIESIIKRVGTLLGFFNPQNTLLKGDLSPWPGGQVPYIIDEKFNDNENQIIMDAIREFHKHTCVRFVPYDDEQAYIRIKLSANGCHSPVGYSGHNFDVHLETPGCGRRKGTVIHELMHVIGFIHEQSRYDRDDYVRINWRDIKNGREYNFYKFQNKDMNNFGIPYDFGSIMHYPADAFAVNDKRIIIPKVPTNIKMGQRKGFSQNDIAKIRKMYDC